MKQHLQAQPQAHPRAQPRAQDYRFHEKDPIIDIIRTAFQQSTFTIEGLAEKSRVGDSTLRNWFYGATRKPQAFTINLVLQALGFRLYIQPQSGDPILVPFATRSSNGASHK